VYADAALDVAGGVLYPFVQKLIGVEASDAEPVCDDTRGEYIFELQICLVQSGVV